MRFVAIDIEATGRDYKNVRQIIQIGAARFENGKMTDTLEILVNPKTSDFNYYVIKKIGIHPKQCRKGMLFEHAFPKLMDFINTDSIIAHSAKNDHKMLNHDLHIIGHSTLMRPIGCSQGYARHVLKTKNNMSLPALCEHVGVTVTQHHNALSDAIMAGNALIKLLQADTTKMKYVLLKGTK